MNRFAVICATFALIVAAPASAQDAEPEGRSAAGIEIWVSTDADDTTVIKTLGRALWSYENSDKYQGIAFEQAIFEPQAGDSKAMERLYVDVADAIGEDWVWKARIGTDFDTVLVD